MPMMDIFRDPKIKMNTIYGTNNPHWQPWHHHDHARITSGYRTTFCILIFI